MEVGGKGVIAMLLWHNKTRRILCSKSPTPDLRYLFFSLVFLTKEGRKEMKLFGISTSVYLHVCWFVL